MFELSPLHAFIFWCMKAWPLSWKMPVFVFLSLKRCLMLLFQTSLMKWMWCWGDLKVFELGIKNDGRNNDGARFWVTPLWPTVGCSCSASAVFLVSPPPVAVDAENTNPGDITQRALRMWIWVVAFCASVECNCWAHFRMSARRISYGSFCWINLHQKCFKRGQIRKPERRFFMESRVGLCDCKCLSIFVFLFVS